jgi:O-antigen/teichoic acid export membrane protein
VVQINFSIIISCLSSQIINLFYGKELINAGPVLAIHIWAVLRFLGIASENI